MDVCELVLEGPRIFRVGDKKFTVFGNARLLSLVKWFGWDGGKKMSDCFGRIGDKSVPVTVAEGYLLATGY
jgi:hypothetical protein